jgi:hypothetical protein
MMGDLLIDVVHSEIFVFYPIKDSCMNNLVGISE